MVPVSASPLRLTGVGAPMLVRCVRLELVALIGKTLSTVDCCPLTGGLTTPAVESAHRTPEPHPRVCSGQRCGHAPWAGPAAHGLRSNRPQTTVEPGRVLTQWAALHCGARPCTDLAQWPIWGKEITFLFPRIVKSISKLPKFRSNSFPVQKIMKQVPLFF
jgi:hypothetical protein